MYFVMTIILFFITFIGFYDCFFFYPYARNIDSISKNIDLKNENIPKFIYQLIDISNENESVESIVTKSLLYRYTKAKSYKMIYWHFNYFLWKKLLKIHFSKEKIYNAYFLIILNDDNNYKNILFSEKIYYLSREEVAEIISNFKYKKNLELKENYKQSLLKGLPVKE